MQTSPLSRTLGTTILTLALLCAAATPSAAADRGTASLDTDRAAQVLPDLPTNHPAVSAGDAAAVGAALADEAAPLVVEHGDQALAETVSDLNRAADTVPPDITAWYADPEQDAVVIEVMEGAAAAAEAWLAETGTEGSAVRIAETDQRPRTYSEIIGGLGYFAGFSQCTIGFSVHTRTWPLEDGFVTAGHCGAVGSPAHSSDGSGQGVFARSVFPGSDAAYVRALSDWHPRPWVSTHSDDGYLPVRGSVDAPLGATVCVSGPVAGFRCGPLTARHMTVYYPQGPVYGLARAELCIMPGESGAPVITPDGQAQGFISGGAGDCTTGGVAYFQPINPVLASWELQLHTS